MAYCNPEKGIKEASQKMCALAFILVNAVEETFDSLCAEFPDAFAPIADYFEFLFNFIL